MRPWLVVTGAAFLLVGAGALAGTLLFPPPGVQHQSTSQLVGRATPPGAVGTFLITGVANVRGTLDVSWSATALISVELNPITCPGGAPSCSGPVLRGWVLNSSGSFSWTGTLQPGYILTWDTGPRVFANVSASAAVTWTVSAPVSFAQVAAELASGLLAVVGVLGLFLGLFLRGGFQTPQAVVSHSADDVEVVAGATGPRTGPTGDGFGPLRREPPSRSE